MPGLNLPASRVDASAELSQLRNLARLTFVNTDDR